MCSIDAVMSLYTSFTRQALKQHALSVTNNSCVSGAHQLAWLPVSLPEHCKLVVSTLPEYYGILEKLRKMVQLEENYLQVTPLGQNLGK